MDQSRLTSPGFLGRLLLLLLCLLALPVLALVLIVQCTVGSPERALRMAIGLDQAGNAGLGGSEDETISSRAWGARQRGEPYGALAVRIIDAGFGQGHCERSFGI